MWWPVALPGASLHAVTRTSGVSTWTSDLALFIVAILRTSGHEHKEYKHGKHHQVNQPEQDVGAAGDEGEHAQDERQRQQHYLLWIEPKNQLLVQRVSGHRDRRDCQPDGRKR